MSNGNHSRPRRLRWPFTSRDQALETFIYKKAPSTRATVEALEFGHQTEMREVDLGLALLRRDFEGDLRANPFIRVLEALEFGVDDEPDDFLAGHKFADPLLGVVDARVAIGELVAQPLAFAVDLSCPPSANVVDRVEGFRRCLLDRECAGEVLTLHDCSLSFNTSRTG